MKSNFSTTFLKLTRSMPPSTHSLYIARTLQCSVRRVAPYPHLFTTIRRRHDSSTKSDEAGVPPPSNSKSHIEDYYKTLLDNPLATPATKEQPTAKLSQSTETADVASAPEDASKIEKARIVFGSKLVGPAMRQRYIEDLPELEATGKGTYIAGIWVPPKPTEPDNCCMSGCVNCVWDGYREELEEWVKRKRGAQEMIAQKRMDAVVDAASRSEDDGVGNDDWGLDDAMDDIPVGIREFMKTEKRLQEQRKAA